MSVSHAQGSSNRAGDALLPYALSTNEAVLHLLGFNAHQIEHGFRANAQRRPFDEEILADFAARIDPQHCLHHTRAVLEKLLGFHPEVFAQATLLMDCKAVYAPAGKTHGAGKRLPAVALKVCVLSLWLEGEALPIAWLFGGEHEADQVLGKALLDEVLPALVEAGAQQLVMDAGFPDGAWLRVRENMDLYADALGQTRSRPVLPGETPPRWTEAPLPKIKQGRKPLSRRVLLCRQLESWQSLGMPADALVVEDRFPDGEVRHFVVACIGADEIDPLKLLARWRARWAIEELFMVADRYRKLGRVFPCREGFARTGVATTVSSAWAILLASCWIIMTSGSPNDPRSWPSSTSVGHPETVVLGFLYPPAGAWTRWVESTATLRSSFAT